MREVECAVDPPSEDADSEGGEEPLDRMQRLLKEAQSHEHIDVALSKEPCLSHLQQEQNVSQTCSFQEAGPIGR